MANVGGLASLSFVAIVLASCASADGASGPLPTQPEIDGGADASQADGSTSTDVTSTDVPPGAISEAEWASLTALYLGEHEVERFASFGCPTGPIGAEYGILPAVGCYWRPGHQGGVDPIRDCKLEPSCRRHADCAGKFDRCRGSADSSCTYPGATPSLCSSDADCTAAPGGRCPPVFEPDTTMCYPTGRCEKGERRCDYREITCSTDADCTEAAGGSCQKRILFARCENQACLADGDCKTGQRCACSDPANLCVPADCATDMDCPAGEQCLLERGCYGRAKAYHCSTPSDTCHAKAECSTSYCTFDGSWACRPLICPIE